MGPVMAVLCEREVPASSWTQLCWSRELEHPARLRTTVAGAPGRGGQASKPARLFKADLPAHATTPLAPILHPPRFSHPHLRQAFG